MSFDVYISCDARGCDARHALAVDEAYALEVQETVSHLVDAGWKFTKAQRSSIARTTKLRITCPKHTGTKR